MRSTENESARPVSTSRRTFLRRAAGVAGAATLTGLSPKLASSGVLGANDRIDMGFIGMGGQGRGDLGGFLGFKEVQAVTVCDIATDHVKQAQKSVNDRYGNQDCAVCKDWREVVADDNLDGRGMAG